MFRLLLASYTCTPSATMQPFAAVELDGDPEDRRVKPYTGSGEVLGIAYQIHLSPDPALYGRCQVAIEGEVQIPAPYGIELPAQCELFAEANGALSTGPLGDDTDAENHLGQTVTARGLWLDRGLTEELPRTASAPGWRVDPTEVAAYMFDVKTYPLQPLFPGYQEVS